MIRVHLKIHGRVQGVFFRAHMREKAEELGVTGWVANDADGAVVAVIEGSENNVNALIDWCHSGPTGSHVEKVEVQKLQYQGEFEGFEIRY